MKITSAIIAVIAVLFVFCNQSFGQYTFPELESYKQKTIDQKTGALRSGLNGNFKKTSDGRYLLNESGEGHYSRFKNVRWNLESETELRDNLLFPLSIMFTVYDKDDHMVYTCENKFDYKNNLIHIIQKKADNTIAKESTFTFKTPVTDHATMVYFLRPLIENLLKGETVRFNFLSSEPGLYRLKAQFVAEDRLTIGAKEIETIKVKVTPDMGAFNLIVDKLVPPTLLWFSKDATHVWLKYEGLESGRRSARIVTTVEEITPLDL